jgi:UDP-N-acetyl-2-amino-2-deoxyglucuronate dehydrogenase
MAARLRFALMGLGNVGRIYVRALKHVPDEELVGVIEASTIVKPGYPARIEIHGEKGSIILGESEVIARDVEGVEPPTLERDNIVTGATDPTGIGTKTHERIIRDFIQAIREDREPMVDSASARRTSELITAIYKSSHEGRTVELSEGRD